MNDTRRLLLFLHLRAKICFSQFSVSRDGEKCKTSHSVAASDGRNHLCFFHPRPDPPVHPLGTLNVALTFNGSRPLKCDCVFTTLSIRTSCVFQTQLCFSTERPVGIPPSGGGGGNLSSGSGGDYYYYYLCCQGSNCDEWFVCTERIWISSRCGGASRSGLLLLLAASLR